MSTYTTTRPLTTEEYISIAYSLSRTIARRGDRLIRNAGDAGANWTALRDAAEGLGALADQVCCDHRWPGGADDDEPDEPATTPQQSTQEAH
jgi:hypothetical protein